MSPFRSSKTAGFRTVKVVPGSGRFRHTYLFWERDYSRYNRIFNIRFHQAIMEPLGFNPFGIRSCVAFFASHALLYEVLPAIDWD
jgi:hypothetical protein